jgi:hypothetical protein
VLACVKLSHVKLRSYIFRTICVELSRRFRCLRSYECARKVFAPTDAAVDEMSFGIIRYTLSNESRKVRVSNYAPGVGQRRSFAKREIKYRRNPPNCGPRPIN